jgi:glycosyltransferase involved in cell wall biosynthesis
VIKAAVDASNIRAGGGVTHLIECLSATTPEELGFKQIVVIGGEETLGRLPERRWLIKRVPPMLRKGPIARFWWKQFELTGKVHDCADILLVPGGSYAGSFRPFVALAQNLLPFDANERSGEGVTLKRLRLHLLEGMQTRTFRRANGVVFMSEISKTHIQHRMGFQPRLSRVVHHGTSSRFFRTPRLQRPPAAFSTSEPFRLLYLSIIEPYKHQDVVVDAVGALRHAGVPVALDLVGPSTSTGRAKLEARIQHWDREGAFMRYRGMVPYEVLESVYAQADAFVFASSCETFGIILLEAMAHGLPVACSHRSALPEVLGTAGIYFDPLSAESARVALGRLFEDLSLRHSLSFRAQERAREFSWKQCADETFGFVREVYEAYQHAGGAGH